MKLTTHSDKIWTIAAVLSDRICDDFINRFEHMGFVEAKVSLPSGAEMMKGLRNNDRLEFQDANLARDLFEQLEDLFPVLSDGARPQSLYERFRVYRYDKAQRFKRHIDGQVQDNGRASRLSFLIYLNDNFTGGATRFDNITIQPAPGMVLMFEHGIKHEGLMVSSGTKYVLRSDVFYE